MSERLPRGRHAIAPNLVAEHQRQRIFIAAAEVLAERGYAGATTTAVAARAGVSTATFYKHFADLWGCLLAAYETAADRLCEEISGACAQDGEWPAHLRAGVDAALGSMAEEPAFARLLSAEPPPEATALVAARLNLVERLATMLRSGRGQHPDAALPGRLEERQIGGVLALVPARIPQGDAEALSELGAELSDLLLGSHEVAADRLPS